MEKYRLDFPKKNRKYVFLIEKNEPKTGISRNGSFGGKLSLIYAGIRPII